MPANPETPIGERLRAAALSIEKSAAGVGSLLAAGGAGAATLGIPLALAMREHERRSRARAGNVGFGAGMAAGLATPTIVRGLYDMTREPRQ